MKKTKFTNKSLSILVAIAFLTCAIFGSTLAWLMDETDTLVNTFSYGDINLTLEETLTDEKGNPVDKKGDPIEAGEEVVKTQDGNIYEMMPGEQYMKDPTVTVQDGSESCWLFIKLTEEGGATISNADGSVDIYDFDDFLEYKVNKEWAPLEVGEHESIYFRIVKGDDDGQVKNAVYQILKDNAVKVKASVTKEMLNALDNNGKDKEHATYPKLSVTAYAIQYSGFEVEVGDGATPTTAQLFAAARAAWAEINGQTN